MIKKMLANLISWYVNRFPKHRGMFWIVKRLGRYCQEMPVLSRYGVYLSCRPADKTFLLALCARYGLVSDFIKEHLEAGMCFIDVGANQGVFSLLASRQVGPSGVVISFEPSRREFRSLLLNIDYNQANNILPFHCGLSDVEGVGLLVAGKDYHTGVSHYSSTDGVPSLQLDLRNWHSFVTSLIQDRSILIKIDVEGYEYRVLHSLCHLIASTQTRGVIIEIDKKLLEVQGATSEDVYQIMHQYNYVPLLGLNYATHYDELFYRHESCS